MVFFEDERIRPKIARAINDSGAIVGTATYTPQGQNDPIAAGQHGVMLVPVQFKAQTGQINNGFDPKLSPSTLHPYPVTSCQAGQDSSVAKVAFNDDATASMFELHVPEASQSLLSIKAPANGVITSKETNITFRALQNPSVYKQVFVELRLKGTTQVAAKIEVVILPYRTSPVPIDLFAVSDSQSSGTSILLGQPERATPSEIASELAADFFQAQINIDSSTLILNVLDVNYDVGMGSSILELNQGAQNGILDVNVSPSAIRRDDELHQLDIALGGYSNTTHIVELSDIEFWNGNNPVHHGELGETLI